MLKIEITPYREFDADFEVRLTHSEFGTIFCEICKEYNLKNVLDDIMIKTKNLMIKYTNDSQYHD